MSTLPAARIRKRLHAIAEELRHHGLPNHATEIDFLAEAGKRSPSLRRKYKYKTGDMKIINGPGMKAYIRSLYYEQGQSIAEIQKITGVQNPGRISTVIKS